MPKDHTNSAKIGRWGRKFVFPFAEDQPRATRLVVVHRAVNGKSNDVQAFPVVGITEIDWKGLVDDIASAITDDADGMTGSQSYVVYAQNAEGENISRLALRCSAEVEDDDDSISSEPATSKGLLGMLMKHTEALQRNSTAAFAGIIRGQGEMLRQQAEMLEKFGDRHMEMVKRSEDLASQQHERELQSVQVSAEIENRQVMVQRFMGLLGPIAKKFGLAAPDSELPIEVHELRDFLGGLSEEQIDHLKMILPPDKMIILLSLMEKNAEREEGGTPPNGHQS